MKKIYLSLLMGLFLNLSYGQIMITSNEMPSAGDTARITQATINPFINFAATGANHVWNFANLRNNGQDLKSYQSVTSTNFVYALFFSNLPFNANRANVATPGTAIPANPLLTIENPFNFYYKSSSVYKQVGFGAEVASIPLPVAFAQQDIIYSLPLNFGAQDTSNSAWNIGFPGVGYYGYAQTRINNVDGWGVLTTPHGTYNVLRVKTELLGNDTIAIDSLGLNFALDRPKTTEYKWLANNEIVPVLQITTTEILGLEIVTEIIYRDDYNTVQPGALSNAYCAGSTFTFPYIAAGSYNPPAFLQTANAFTAQLSDSTGSFANPVNIGNITAIASGNITVTIPSNTPAGLHYRIRLVASSPVVTGGDNGFDIIIEEPALSAITTSGATSFCMGDSVLLQSASQASGYSYQWQLNASDLTNATGTDLYALTSGTYTLNTTNSCGTVASNSISVNVNSLPVASILSSGTSFCSGDSLVLNALTDTTYSYQWQLNGLAINGEVSSSLAVTQPGDYSVVVNNGLCGPVTSAAVQVNVNSATVAAITPPSGTTICAGDTVLLSALTDSTYSYQWQLNGTDIIGEVTSSLAVTQAGDYAVIVNGLCGADSSAAITITVNPLPTAAITSGNSTVCANDSVLLTAGSGSGYTYQWQLNGVDISGETQMTYSALASGNYSAVISNACGNAISNTIAVTVYPAVTAPVISLQTDSLVSTPAVSYQWYFNGVLISGATDAGYVPTQNGDYTVVITDLNGCTNTSAIFTMTTVGIQDVAGVSSLNVYPNPVSEVLVVSGQSTSASVSMKILTPSGQYVKMMAASAAGKSFKSFMDVSDLASGMYVLQVQDGASISYQKFVKK